MLRITGQILRCAQDDRDFAQDDRDFAQDDISGCHSERSEESWVFLGSFAVLRMTGGAQDDRGRSG